MSVLFELTRENPASNIPSIHLPYPQQHSAYSRGSDQGYNGSVVVEYDHELGIWLEKRTTLDILF